MIRASVAGASGYAGGELLRLLAGHPGIELAALAAGGRAGEPLAAVHPNLAGLGDRMLVETDAATLADADIVFLALPHGESAALVAQLPADLPVVDLGADFRLRDAVAWDSYYGGAHAGTWTYGLPELPGQREAIARVASRRESRLLRHVRRPRAGTGARRRASRSPQDVVVVAASGTSGAGRKPSDALLATQVMGSMSAYKVGGVAPAHAGDGAVARRRWRASR